jgi:hypothetical protein
VIGRILAALLLVLAGAGVLAAQQAQQYDQPAPQRVAQVLAPDMIRGPHFRVQDPVAFDGYMFRFNVTSDYGPFESTGIGALRKLEGEIQAIAQLRAMRGEKAFGKAVLDSATGPFKLMGHLVTHPVDTFTGVPKGAWKLMEDAGEAIVTERNPSDDPAYAKLLLMSGNKRNYAAQLGVDVYSRNPVLQKELNSVGWAAALGNLTVSAALMPVGGAAGAAVSLTRWSNALNDYTKQEPASRLRIISSDKLKASGIPAETTERFLNNRAFTPRQWIVVAEALSRLGPAPANGRDALLELAAAAQDDVETDFFVNMVQILRGYHEQVSPLTGLQRVGPRLMAGRAQNGTTVVPLAIDYLIWTPTVQQRAQAMRALGTVDLWLLGKTSPLAKQNLTALGLRITEEVGKRVEIVD